MKFIFVLIVFILFYCNLKGQITDSLIIKEKLILTIHNKNNRLSTSEIRDRLYKYPLASKNFKKAKDNELLGDVLLYSGGLLVGVSVSKLVKNRNEWWEMGCAGVTLIGVSIPFYRLSNKHKRKAIKNYNKAR